MNQSLHPDFKNSTDISEFVGVFLPTTYVRGKLDGRSRIEFSPNDNLFVHILPSHEAVEVWNVETRTLVIMLQQSHIQTVRFSSDESCLAILGETSGMIWDLLKNQIRCHLDSSTYQFSDPIFACFDELDNALLVTSSSHVLSFDIDSGRLRTAQPLLDSATDPMVWSLDSNGNLISEITSLSEDGEIVRDLSYASLLQPRVTSIFNLSKNISVILAENHIAVVRNNMTSMAQVIDVREKRLLCAFHHSTFIGNIRLGPDLGWLAYAYDPPGPRTGCVLQIWDLRSGQRLHELAGTISWNILWSQRSGIMAMYNSFPYEQFPKRNLSLLLDPLTMELVAHTYGQSGTGDNTYCFSPSGRFLCSVFLQDYWDNSGTIIRGGSIAITDLGPIIRPT